MSDCTVSLTGLGFSVNGGPGSPPVKYKSDSGGVFVQGYGLTPYSFPVDAIFSDPDITSLRSDMSPNTFNPTKLTPALTTLGGWYLFLNPNSTFVPKVGDEMVVSGSTPYGLDGNWGPDWSSAFSPLPVSGVAASGVASSAAEQLIVVQQLTGSVTRNLGSATANIVFYRSNRFGLQTSSNFPLNTVVGKSVQVGFGGTVTLGSIVPSGTCNFAIQGIGLSSGLGTFFIRTQVSFLSDSTYRRWAMAPYNGQLFLTNELNPVCFTDGTTLARYSNPQPSARYLSVFYDHLVLGWPVWQGTASPTKVRWSDLYKLNSWEPQPTNEADSYDVEEWCRSDFPLRGITGFGQSNTTLWVFTPTAILSCRYVGRPKVMQVGERVIRDVGNTLSWGLVSYKDVHYFWDGVEQDFYRFDGEQVNSIGIKIKGFFLSNINQSWPLLQATWGYVRPGRQEIVWCFVSNKQTSLVFDKAVVYNWKSEKWYTASVENLHAFTGPVLPAGRAEDLVSTADTLTGPADQLLQATNLTPPLWGTVGGAVLREGVLTDADSSCLAQDTPTLETKDWTYGDLEAIKEGSSMVLHCNYKGAPSGPGVSVEIATRINLDDAVVYQPASTWRNNLVEGRLGTPRTSGRIMRWRFKPLGTTPRGFTFSGFVENVYRNKADV